MVFFRDILPPRLCISCLAILATVTAPHSFLDSTRLRILDVVREPQSFTLCNTLKLVNCIAFVNYICELRDNLSL